MFPRYCLFAALSLPGMAGAQLFQPAPESPWRLAVAAGWGWETNVGFRNPPVVADAATVATAELSGSRRRPRFTSLLAAQGSMLRYQTLRSLDRYSYDARAEASRDISTRLSGFVRGSARLGLESEAQSLDASRVLLPFVVSRTQAAAAGGMYRVSALTTAGFEARYTHASFDAPGLTSTSSIGYRMAMLHRYNGRSSYGLTLLMDEYDQADARRYVQTIATEWAPRSGGFAARFIAGASTIGPTISSFTSITPTGSTELQSPLGRGTTNVRYERFVGQSFGLGGLLVTDRVLAAYERSPRHGIQLRLGGDRSWSRNPETTEARTITTNLTGRLTKQFASGLTLGNELFLQERNQIVAVSDRGVRVLAGYALGGWRKR